MPDSTVSRSGVIAALPADLIFGARISLSIGFIATLISITLGTILGAFAGFFGGKLDTLVMRFTDMVLAFPRLVLLIMIVALFGDRDFVKICDFGFATLLTPKESINDGKSLTPRIDAFAAQSVNFTKAYAQASNTPRSVPSFLTSRYPSQVKVDKMFRPYPTVDDANVTLFEAMKARLAGIASQVGMTGVFRLLGSDVFRVRAINEDGVVSRQDAVLPLAIEPTLVQSLPFRIACAIALGALFATLYRMRVRYLTARSPLIEFDMRGDDR